MKIIYWKGNLLIVSLIILFFMISTVNALTSCTTGNIIPVFVDGRTDDEECIAAGYPGGCILHCCPFPACQNIGCMHLLEGGCDCDCFKDHWSFACCSDCIPVCLSVCGGEDNGCGRPCPLNDGVACDDGLWCNGADTCGGGFCSVHAGSPCEDDNVCTDDACNEITNACDNMNNANPCDDGFWCNGADTCSGGSCSVHAGRNCDDSDICTDDSCNETADKCQYSYNSNSCDDGFWCNGADTCGGGVCLHAGNPCDDVNDCTTDPCNEIGKFCGIHANKPDGALCDDSLFCNGLDNCSGGFCSVHAGFPCDDGNDCTDDFCNETGDSCQPSVNKPDGVFCNDSLFCNGLDSCSGGFCSVHAGFPCDDSDPATLDICNETTDNCTHVLNLCAGGTGTDDPNCGTIDCGGWYTQKGIEAPNGTEECRSKQDITTNRCEDIGDCKDNNTEDCDMQADDILQYSCGVCQYIDNSTCNGTILGACIDYPLDTRCDLCTGCDGLGNCNTAIADDDACGTIDCSNWYNSTGIESADEKIPAEVETCWNYENFDDANKDRCEGIGDCKDGNTDDCYERPFDVVQYICNECQYIKNDTDCFQANRGVCTNYPDCINCTMLSGKKGGCFNGCCDIDPPTAGVTNDPLNWVNVNVLATVTCSDAGACISGCNAASYSYWVYHSTGVLDTGPAACPTGKGNYTNGNSVILQNHSWVCSYVEDNACNPDISNKPVEFKIDQIPPVPVAPSTTDWKAGTVDINFTYSDEGDSRLDVCDWTVWAADPAGNTQLVDFGSFLCAGEYNITYTLAFDTLAECGKTGFSSCVFLFYSYASDNSGNENEDIGDDYIGADNDPPTVSIAGKPLIPTYYYANAYVVCEDTYSGCDWSTYRMKLGGACTNVYSDYTIANPYTMLLAGTYDLCATAKDNANNTAFTAVPTTFIISARPVVIPTGNLTVIIIEPI